MKFPQFRRPSRCAALEAELATVRAERDQLRSLLALGDRRPISSPLQHHSALSSRPSMTRAFVSVEPSPARCARHSRDDQAADTTRLRVVPKAVS